MIEGSLREVGLPDLLDLVGGGRKSGVLAVRHGEREARLAFGAGRLLHARLGAGSHLGEYLVRLELLASEEVQGLVARQPAENPHLPLGLLAVREGLLGEADLRIALEAQALDVLTEVLRWSEHPRTRFELTERNDPPPPAVPAFEPKGLLVEAARRLDEWRRGQVRPGAVLEPAAPFPSSATGEPPLPLRELLGLVDGARTAASLAAELPPPEGETYRGLHLLLEAGLVREAVVRPEEPLVLVVSGSPTVRGLAALALTRERYRVAVAPDLGRGRGLLESAHPNAVLLDWPSPLEAARSLRAVRGRAHTPILALGPEPRPGRRGQPQGLRLVPRPFTDGALVAAVGRVTRRAV